jgi:endogenous inhibitor of DNA gyrase (YacG/DUF329 family)
MKCPICKKSVLEVDAAGKRNPTYPFCGERCKLIDLGRWLDGAYQIPVAETDAGADADDEGLPGADVDDDGLPGA